MKVCDFLLEDFFVNLFGFGLVLFFQTSIFSAQSLVF